MCSNHRLRGGLLLAGLMIGCESAGDRPGNVAIQNQFAPVAMRINPVFSKVTDLNHSGHVDGVEVQLEFTDAFGDRTKASGRVMFELFEYRRDVDPRSKRVAGPWVFSIESFAQQKEGWSSTLRSYRFPLGDPGIKADESYVLSAVFELSTGGRFFDQICLAGQKPESKNGPLLGQELPFARPATTPVDDTH